MRQIFQRSYLSRELCIEDIPAPALNGTGVLVRNAASLISPGTERATVSFARKGVLEKLRSQPERAQLLWRRMGQHGVWETLQLAQRKLASPIPLGYSSAGVVIDVSRDLTGIRIGQRVACAGAAHANHAEVVHIPKNLFVPLPDALSFEEGAFVAPGAIALHGVRQAQIGLGETVLVIGLGLIGQLAMQLVKAQGGIPIGVDLSRDRLRLAKDTGFPHVFRRTDPGLNQAIAQLTGGRGVDAVMITAATPSDDPVIMAGELARERGRIVVVGDVGMKVPRSIYYHKELSLIVSRSYGPGRYDERYERDGQDYPAAYVRWTERDNMAAFLQLAVQGAIQLAPLITHRFDLAQAEAAYDLLLNPATGGISPVGIVLNYPQPDIASTNALDKSLILRNEQAAPASTQQIGLGLIGSGNFMRGTLLPLLKAQPGWTLRNFASNNGLAVKELARQYGFSACTTDTDSLLRDDGVQAVIIATRHDSHAKLAEEALKNGKHVFLEKPLATNLAELTSCLRIAKSHPAQRLMVDFNRRFAPFTQTLKTLLSETAPGAMSIHYRINGGPVPQESWIHQHGGRVVGEICHFIDWVIHLTGEYPVSVYATRSGQGVNHDLSIQLTLAEGSQASIQYLMRNSATGLGKERIELYTPTLTAELDDFKTLRYHHNGKTKVVKNRKIEKGHREALKAFQNAILEGKPSPISAEELAVTTLTTFAILEALKTGLPTPVSLAEIAP